MELGKYRSFLFAMVGAVLYTLAGCTTVPTLHVRRQLNPTLSVWQDPATSMAISWFDTPGIAGIELADSSGVVRRVQAEVVGEVTRVLVGDLDPAERYRYRAELKDGSYDGTWYSFSTISNTELTEDESFTFAVAGDLQPFNSETLRTTRMTLEKIRSLEPSFILQTGDVAEVGTSTPSWRLAALTLSAAGSEIPIVATAGNHDYYYAIPSAGHFKAFFPAPYAQKSTRKNTWYSIDAGPVHIAVLDTEVKGSWIKHQVDWLSADLAQARSIGAEWIFVAMHRPLFTNTGSSRYLNWMSMVLPLLHHHGVDAVFWGHQHLYQHFYYRYGANGLVFDTADEIAESPIHYFTAGTSGARVDSIYGRFFTRPEITEQWDMYRKESGEPVTLRFSRHTWSRNRVKREMPGVRYQDPERYPDAGSYYSYPFDSAEDAENGIYSHDPAKRYADISEFIGHTYGETSIHYLWVEIQGNTCTISAHYPDQAAGVPGTIIMTPDGREEKWLIVHE